MWSGHKGSAHIVCRVCIPCQMCLKGHNGQVSVAFEAKQRTSVNVWSNPVNFTKILVHRALGKPTWLHRCAYGMCSSPMCSSPNMCSSFIPLAHQAPPFWLQNCQWDGLCNSWDYLANVHVLQMIICLLCVVMRSKDCLWFLKRYQKTFWLSNCYK